MTTKTLEFFGASFLAALTSSVAFAGEWQTTAGLGIGTFYTTNVCRVPKDIAAEEEAETAGTLSPRFTINGEGGRTRLNLTAAAEYNSLADSSIECPPGSQVLAFDNQEPWVPSVSGDGVYELVEDWLEIYATAFASQNPVNPFAAGGLDNNNAAGNTNITYQVGAGARIERALPDEWQLLADVGYNRQYNSVDQFIGNSEEVRGFFDFGKDPFAERFTYGVRAFYSEIDFDETDSFGAAFSNRLSRAELYTGLLLSQTLVLQALVGEESNEFDSQDDELDGTIWDVGFLWQPLARVSLSVGYGERFFGETPRFSLSYQSKRSVLAAGYTRDVQFPRDLRGSPVGFADSQVTAPVVEIPGSGLSNGGTPTLPSNGAIQVDAFFIDYRLQGRRSEFAVTGSLSEQFVLATGESADFQSATISFSRNLNSNLAGQVNVNWNRSEQSDQVSQFLPFEGLETTSIEIGLSRPISRKTSLALRYQALVQEPVDRPEGEIEEQRVTLSLNYDF